MRSPERRIYKSAHRTLSQVDPELLSTLHKLAIGKAHWPLLLHGDPGVGKTYAALALCDLADTATLWTVDDIADKVVAKDPWPWQSAKRDALVVVDELGERELNDLLYTSFKRLIDLREYHAGRVGIYISNLPPKDLADILDDRLLSRLTAGTVFHLTGPDRRSRKTSLF